MARDKSIELCALGLGLLLCLGGGFAFWIGCDPDIPNTCGSVRILSGRVLQVTTEVRYSTGDGKGHGGGRPYNVWVATVWQSDKNATCAVVDQYPPRPIVNATLIYARDGDNCNPGRVNDRRAATIAGISMLSAGGAFIVYAYASVCWKDWKDWTDKPASRSSSEPAVV
jgi:hypothetical protein